MDIQYGKEINDAFAKLKIAKVIKYDADVSRDLNFSKSAISEFLKGNRDVSESFVNKFNEYYKQYGVQIEDSSRNVVANFRETKATYEQNGYSPTTPKLNPDQTNSMLMANSSVGYATLELVCRALSKLEDRPLDEIRAEANRLTHDKMSTFELLLKEMISLP